MFPQSRLLAATLAARRSPDRRTLDVLLVIADLPAGWEQTHEWRYRIGFIFSEDRDKRARRAKLIGAARLSVDAESGSRITTAIVPLDQEDDDVLHDQA